MAQTWKPTKQQIAEAADKTLPDLIAPGLRVLFVGINPSLYTAAVGHHFARPGNRFWKVLHLAGFTDRQLSPFEEHELLDRGFGITNVVARVTCSADKLSRDEIRAGGELITRKAEKFSPEVIAVLGVLAYRTAFEVSKATVGEQRARIGPSKVWVLPNPSGLQAHYQLNDMVELYGALELTVGD